MKESRILIGLRDEDLNKLRDALTLKEKKIMELTAELNEQKRKSGSECLIGPAAEKILEYADAKKADMIVMGSSNRLRGISKIKALGSVTRKVSELANFPVLIVH